MIFSLQFPFKELVEIFNIDNSIQASYYFMQKTVESEKHIFKIGDTGEDDCRCDKCENVELLLISVKNTLKDSHPDLVTSFSVDPQTFVSQLVCSVKNYYCCNDVWSECPGNIVIINPIAAILEKVDEISYAKWVYDGRYKKIERTDRGADVAELLNNIFRQFSELKHLKSQLKDDEVICSVDFSKNYENKQNHEIQSAYFGHEAFTLFTAACYYKPLSATDCEVDIDSGLAIHSVVVVSNERNIAFTCNNKLIEIMRNLIPGLKTVYIWSDGCATQFRSKFVFRSLSFYPSDLKIYWDYGEAHHFKGPRDGIGGTVKRKVYRDVTSGKVIIKDAMNFTEYANKVCKVQVEYLDKSEVVSVDLSDAIHVYGTLKVHHVDRISIAELEFYLNSPYKNEAEILTSIQYQKDKVLSRSDEQSIVPADVIDFQALKSPPVGDVIIVKYATKKKVLTYLAVVQSVNDDEFSVQFLKSSGAKTYSIKEGDTDVVKAEDIVNIIHKF